MMASGWLSLAQKNTCQVTHNVPVLTTTVASWRDPCHASNGCPCLVCMVIMQAHKIASLLTMTQSSSQPRTPRVVETEFHVRYAETDAMGVVHHATYLVYFEEGRSHYMRSMGSDYAEIEAQGFQLPVTEVAVRFAGSLGYGQRVRVRTWIEENRSRQLTFAYEVVDADSRKSLVTGFTRHVWTDRKGRVTRQPPQWQEKFAGFA